jgi:catechol 2,3-dioxygenase-like lactoylglutathione lyase family enzyme
MTRPALDVAIPIMPCHDMPGVIAFYHRLGFVLMGDWYAMGYAILRRGAVEIHLFRHLAHQPEAALSGCYVRVADADRLYDDWSRLGLADHGIPRLVPPENKSWGMREFAIVDPSGNLMRVGSMIEPG